MDGPRECHTDWSKSERENKILYINTYMWVEVCVYIHIYIYIFFSRKTMKSCPSGTTDFNGKRGQPVGNMGSLPPLPPQRLGLHAARGGARWTQSNSWGHSCDWAKTYWRREKKRRILWLSRQNQTSIFNNYNGKRHFNLGVEGRVGLTVYQGLSPLGALTCFPWSERLPGWKLIREVCQ